VFKIIKHNLFFILPYLFFIIVSMIVLSIFGKMDVHIFINRWHSSFSDVFFKYYTHTGNGIFAAFISIILLFVKYRYAIVSALSATLSGIIIQLFKLLVFKDSYRPVLYFKTFYTGDYQLHLVPGVEPGNLYSFPSGHSATAFAIFFLLAVIIKTKYLKFLLFIIAFFSAFSRVYLSWHFLGDIAAGSIIGVLFTLVIYWLISRSKTPWLDKSII
jgi:membrane-associated phospholipid phosphatase